MVARQNDRVGLLLAPRARDPPQQTTSQANTICRLRWRPPIQRANPPRTSSGFPKDTGPARRPAQVTTKIQPNREDRIRVMAFTNTTTVAAQRNSSPACMVPPTRGRQPNRSRYART
jgi:hypothetical protein